MQNIWISVLITTLIECEALNRKSSSAHNQLPLDQPSADSSVNVVLIVADDLGWADVSINNATGDIKTPNIDSIGLNGVHFPQGYATAPVCGPSRAALLTGRYQQRFGFEFNAGGSSWAFNQSLGLDVHEITLADLARAAGRRTALIGKWHLGNRAQFEPTNRGFDEFYGFLAGQTSYIDPGTPGEMSIDSMKISSSVVKARSKYDIHAQIRRSPGGEIIKNQKSYLTEELTREAVEFIERNHARPFFLEVAYNAPHAPLQTTKKYYSRFEHITNEARRIYAGMISAVDDGVGEILAKLDMHSLTKNTLVIFVSDNGCPTRSEACSCGPLRGGKLTMFEGGIRVPFVMKWPVAIAPKQKYAQTVSLLDIWPTVVAAMSGSFPEHHQVDGVNLLPFLSGDKVGKPHDILYWRSDNHYAIRQNSWKLWHATGGHSKNFSLLYDLTIDEAETSDVSTFLETMVDDLLGLVESWNSSLANPKWSPRRVVSSDCENTIHFDVAL